MIRFGDRDWDRIRATYRKWWKNELGRPILPCVFYGADPGRAAPSNRSLWFGNVNDFSVSAEQIVDRMDFDLSCMEFAGDSFPFVRMDMFGPGVAAAFLGAELHNDSNTVWFHVGEKKPIEDIHPEYDPKNIWLDRIKAIYAAGMKKWKGNVVMGITDLGGILDVLATFRGSDNLLMDLYDSPDQVKRLIGEIQGMWQKFYGEIAGILEGSQGYSNWSSIYSERPSYMLQSDFSFMIGPQMFGEFTMPELETTAAVLDRPFYHLDGVNQIPHLEHLLESRTISGIQWVPGEGEPLGADWSELYQKIERSGKKIQVYYDLDTYYREILNAIDCPDSLVKMEFGYPISKKSEILGRLAAEGV